MIVRTPGLRVLLAALVSRPAALLSFLHDGSVGAADGCALLLIALAKLLFLVGSCGAAEHVLARLPVDSSLLLSFMSN